MADLDRLPLVLSSGLSVTWRQQASSDDQVQHGDGVVTAAGASRWLSCGQALAVAFGGVGEVEFVPVAVVPVEPFGYPADVQSGAQDPVLDVAGHFSNAAPLVVGDRAGLGFPELGSYLLGESLALGAHALLAGPDFECDLVDGQGGDEEAEQGTRRSWRSAITMPADEAKSAPDQRRQRRSARRSGAGGGRPIPGSVPGR